MCEMQKRTLFIRENARNLRDCRNIFLLRCKTASNGIISIKYKRVQEKRKFVKKSYVIGDEKNKLVHKLIVGICIAIYIA